MSLTALAKTTGGATPAQAATPAENPMARMFSAIMMLSREDATADTFMTVQHTLAGLKQLVAEYSALAAEASIEYVRRNGPVETDTERYYLGRTKTTRCRDTAAAVEAIFTASGGDIGTLVGLLASQPLKHGACKGVLGEQWAEHFETTESDKVEVKRVDPRMLPG